MTQDKAKTPTLEEVGNAIDCFGAKLDSLEDMLGYLAHTAESAGGPQAEAVGLFFTLQNLVGGLKAETQQILADFSKAMGARS